MSFFMVLHFALTLMTGIGLAIFWMRTQAKNKKDDPRLSRGLQLLQSKIAILEDLSDRTEQQSQKIMQLIEQKTKQLQMKIIEAQSHVEKVDQNIQKSMEVAEIFQDKIPHEKIIERQNTIKYVQAARLAHQGKSVQEIAQAVQLPVSEISLIAKVNKENLVFEESRLPGWAQQAQRSQDSVVSNEPFIEMNDRSNIAGDIAAQLSAQGAQSHQAPIASNAVAQTIAQQTATTQASQSVPQAAPSAEPATQQSVQKLQFPRIGISTTRNLT